MPEFQLLQVLTVMLRSHVAEVRLAWADPDQRERGDIVQTVIIIAAFAIAAIAIVAIIVNKVTTKANSITTE